MENSIQSNEIQYGACNDSESKIMGSKAGTDKLWVLAGYWLLIDKTKSDKFTICFIKQLS